MDDRAIAWVQMMRDELKARVDKGEGAVKGEKHRILWLQTAPLFLDVTKMLEDEFQAAIVLSELDDVGRRGEIQQEDPIEALARSALVISWNGLAQNRVNRVLHLAEEFKVDACIHFSQWGCKVASNSAGVIKDALEKELGIPTLILTGDYMDVRNYSENTYRTQFESLMEML
jgi:benzoyl-CoA reductase/2-hydroxyglutaryl-CoA dehydratase subunit BcrC/BadD/HgdB